MKTILVTGANGQLGNSIRLLAGKYSGYNFLFTDVDTLDITDPAAVRAVVKDNGVNYILNCAAYTAVDKAEDDEALCRRINTFAVGVLGKAAHEAGAKMIHVSTDYVFSGTNCRPYVETDATRPVSAYGRTKLAGEEILQEVCPDAVIIRTAWLYSEFGNNFVKTVLRLGKERDELGFVFDAAFKILAREKLVIFIAQMNSGDERRGNNSRIIAAAAVYHILPHEHSEPVAVIVPAQRLDLYVLAQHIKAHVLGGLNVKNERLIRRGGVHAVGPVALIEQTVVEIRLAV